MPYKYREDLIQYRKNRQLKYGSLLSLKRQIDRKERPWLYLLVDIKKRCNNPKNISYKTYGGRGIKCLITASELKELWFRDNAYYLEHPSIDRIDNDGNYTFVIVNL